MSEILSGLFFINDVDVWTRYGVFLTESREGGRDNQAAIMAASKLKEHTAVNIREENGEKYSKKLAVANEARDVTLLFALYAPTRADWLKKYRDFISFLKTGSDGWLTLRFPQLGLEMKVFYKECSNFKPLTWLFKEGVQASSFKVKFREPEPIF